VSTFTVRITPAAADVIRRLPPDVKRAAKAAVRSLVADPELGIPLQRELSDLWR
jgi:mRNA-degrading endonuclease RelE of RelBE toxin-antitoxin system